MTVHVVEVTVNRRDGGSVNDNGGCGIRCSRGVLVALTVAV